MSPEQEPNFPVTEEERWKYLFTSINNLTASLNETRSKIHASSKVIELVDKRVNELENRLTQSDLSLSALRDLSRSRNIVLFNLTDTDEVNSDLISGVCNVFQKVDLHIPDLAFDDVFRLGRDQGNRPTLVKFISSRWVRKVFGKVRELRSQNIFISNDRSKEERENRRKLLDQARKLREKGQNAVVKGNRIFISHEKFIDNKSQSLIKDSSLPEGNSSRKRSLTSPPSSRLSTKIPEKIIKKNKKMTSKGDSKSSQINESLDNFFLNSRQSTSDDVIKNHSSASGGMVLEE
ncbi:uncharacterized protein LOC122498335 [Leptopilina heterotoma]|uniref:uncharacterized protein LOC122498335 n=1 Tax=Leptopilina heterotoma TaxID=63436 RepID=UPI001CA983AF|nr:uncharacterized protein LOC122498335 [Leptopilina heterotoma]